MNSQEEGVVTVAHDSPSFDLPEFQLAILEHHMSTVNGMKKYLQYFIQVHHHFSQEHFQKVVFGVWQRATKGIRTTRDRTLCRKLKKVQTLLEQSVGQAADMAARVTRLQQAVTELNGIAFAMTPLYHNVNVL